MADGLPRAPVAPTRKLPRALRDLAAAARADLVRVVDDPKLAECCVFGSFYLQTLALEQGFAVEVAAGHVPRRGTILGVTSHAWCTFDGWVVDITATQFWQVPEVYVVSAAHRRYSEVHARGLEVLLHCADPYKLAKRLHAVGIGRLARVKP